MPLYSAFVIYAFAWFISLLVVLPLRLTTQGEAGEKVAGTPSSAPVNPQLRKKLVITTVAATVVFVLIYVTIVYGGITLEDIDVINRWANG
ncbi:DUF1467 family protein [Pararhodobacter oceanensis]|uniref:DUF1467 domain-containing protein n=1 Tax=Pararhodobacter oceanensis TaxID=2172121 RepID=A0A2T8HWH7_9RHOB|nr:DUF1467 family protein [Pararhodobacter oceanensis]PVH29754.1 DUF1467 domain-containing protein [Pararhodobacter oceanensis]